MSDKQLLYITALSSLGIFVLVLSLFIEMNVRRFNTWPQMRAISKSMREASDTFLKLAEERGNERRKTEKEKMAQA